MPGGSTSFRSTTWRHVNVLRWMDGSFGQAQLFARHRIGGHWLRSRLEVEESAPAEREFRSR
jgi:hypothetical protein